MDALIEIDNLSKHFGELVAVDNVTFSVARGEVVGFLGPNGAGKSTTMKMVTGFLTPSAGKISVCGHSVADNPLAAKTAIGYLPEGAPAYPEMTPLGFLRFIADVRGMGASLREERIREVVSKVHLEGVLHQPIDTLSKGFKRRVGLAQAILHDPKVLILDEPTDGLDPNQKHEVRSLIQEMASDKAILLSTHILEEVDAVCTRAMIINKGRVVQDGTPAELQSRSKLHNAVTIRMAADKAASARNDLQTLNGVAGIQELTGSADQNGSVSFQVLASNGQSIINQVGVRMREKQWDVEEMHVEKARLDDVFRSLTSSDVSETTVSGGVS